MPVFLNILSYMRFYKNYGLLWELYYSSYAKHGITEHSSYTLSTFLKYHIYFVRDFNGNTFTETLCGQIWLQSL